MFLTCSVQVDVACVRRFTRDFRHDSLIFWFTGLKKLHIYSNELYEIMHKHKHVKKHNKMNESFWTNESFVKSYRKLD